MLTHAANKPGPCPSKTCDWSTLYKICHQRVALYLAPLFLGPKCIPNALRGVPNSLLFPEQGCNLLSKGWGFSEAASYGVAGGRVDQVGCSPKGCDGLLCYRQGAPYWDERPLLLMNLLHLMATQQHVETLRRTIVLLAECTARKSRVLCSASHGQQSMMSQLGFLYHILTPCERAHTP